ncbi:MAG: hypothetical protein IKC63_01505 [Clostridia bacterium]|nr:hypothetical protein [Clostridia bacterium]
MENEIKAPLDGVTDTSAVTEDEDVLVRTTETPAELPTPSPASENALADALSFASLYAKEGGEVGEELVSSEVFRRFTALRGMGLSVKEAFYAADSSRDKRSTLPSAGKEHLTASHTKLRQNGHYVSGEELSMIKELLGEDYSTDDVMKLIRRVSH